MKTLKQIIEGAVVMSDFKLDRKGRKYKAHRMSMGGDMKEDLNPYTKVYEEDTFTKTLPRMGNKALDTAKGLISPYEKAMSDMSPGSDYYKKNIENNPEAKAKVDDFMKSAPKASELDSSIDKTKQKFNKALTNKGTVGKDIEQVDEIALKPEHRAAIKRLRPNGSHSKTSFKLDSGKTYYATREGDDVHLVTHETGAGTSKKTTMKYSRFDEEVEQVDEISKGSIEKYMNKAVSDFGHQNFISRVGKGSDKEDADRKAMNRSKGIERAVLKTTKKNMGEAADQETMNAERSKVLSRFIKGATPKNGQVVDNVDTSGEVSEARGRPAGAATLAKRAAAAAKPREDDEEGEHYEADSGVEADQHIHVQLKKAADSDQKPFEVSFKNGKKHTVSQKVAKDILSATERLKPEHRKNVHDEIHHSYDNLMSVHRLVARK